jgi:hypothetical protein
MEIRATNITRVGEKRKFVQNFVGKPEGKRLLGIHGRRWEDNIKVTLKK